MFKMLQSTIFLIHIMYIGVLCLQVLGKGSVFSCVGDYCMKRDSPLPKEEDGNRQYIICSDDGKGDIDCRYSSALTEEADKEAQTRAPTSNSNKHQEKINPTIARGNNDPSVRERIKPDINQLNSHRKPISKTENASVISSNNTIQNTETNSDTGGNNSDTPLHKLKADSNLTVAQQTHNASQYGMLRFFAILLDSWSYGYNETIKLFESGKCPMPWLTSSRFHCNAVEGEEVSWIVLAVTFALLPVLGYVCFLLF